MGVRNIMINIKGYAKSYFGHILNNESVTKYVETPLELVNEIQKLTPTNKWEIIEANSKQITPRYRENLEKYLRKLKLIN
jgi:hypothetical protein